MRTFNLISAWLLWLFCAFYTLCTLVIRILDVIPRPEKSSPEKLTRYVQTFWIALAVFAVFAAGAYLARRHFWFARGRGAGLGFWSVTMFFYLSVLFLTATGFAPYVVGDRSSIQFASCGLGVLFLVIGFPRVPQASAVSAPPPLPPDQNPKFA